MNAKKIKIGTTFLDNKNIYINDMDYANSVFMVVGKDSPFKEYYYRSILKNYSDSEGPSFILGFDSMYKRIERLLENQPNIVDLNSHYVFDIDNLENKMNKGLYDKILYDIPSVNNRISELLECLDDNVKLKPSSKRYLYSISTLYHYVYPKGSLDMLFEIMNSYEKVNELLEKVSELIDSFNPKSESEQYFLDELILTFKIINKKTTIIYLFEDLKVQYCDLFKKIEFLYKDKVVVNLLQSNLLYNSDFTKFMSDNQITLINIPEYHKESVYHKFITTYFMSMIIDARYKESKEDDCCKLRVLLDDIYYIGSSIKRELLGIRSINLSMDVFISNINNIDTLLSILGLISYYFNGVFLDNDIDKSAFNDKIFKKYFPHYDKSKVIPFVDDLNNAQGYVLLSKESELTSRIVRLLQ